ncbi:T9SS type A sorting domain-containing protein [Flavobacteriaceae bacterium SZ-1-7]|uniref:T9SS type A sorting domain-containing protein n=1 Tax=Tamlana sedimenti TaxID=3134126 RepID=UPI0031235E17
MKIFLPLAFIFSFVFSIQGQTNSDSKSYTIVRSNLGAGGSSRVVSTQKGNYKVSQSIGQSSVIGTHYGNGFALRQGYQQPLNNIKVVPISRNNNLVAHVYPNPFEESVDVTFSQDIKKDVSVLVFDVAGKLVYSKEFKPSQKINLNLVDISSGSYLLKVMSDDKLFNAKLIKK